MIAVVLDSTGHMVARVPRVPEFLGRQATRPVLDVQLYLSIVPSDRNAAPCRADIALDEALDRLARKIVETAGGRI